MYDPEVALAALARAETLFPWRELLALAKVALEDRHRRACERIPEGVALTDEEWARAECHNCHACRFNEAVTALAESLAA